MHDLLEGTLNFVMSIVIVKMCKRPCIDLDLMNNTIALFDFGSYNNKPIRITNEKLDKKHLGVSAAEMSNLVKYLLLYNEQGIYSTCKLCLTIIFNCSICFGNFVKENHKPRDCCLPRPPYNYAS